MTTDELAHAALVFQKAYTLQIGQLLTYAALCPILRKPVIGATIVERSLRLSRRTRNFEEAILAMRFPVSFNDILQIDRSDKGALAAFASEVAGHILSGGSNGD